MSFRSGVVAVVGKPNVGKSTLVNYIVGAKVAIVTPRPQTTRKSILGIANIGKVAQIVFVDTPGIHQPKTELAKTMVNEAIHTIQQADAVVFVVDVSHPPDEKDKRIAAVLKQEGFLPQKKSTPAENEKSPGRNDDDVRTVVALNKMDRLRPEHVIANFDAYEALTEPAPVMYTNALTGENVDKLLNLLIKILPEQPPLYDDPQFYTNQTLRQLCAEIIREKALLNTRQEVPHGISVKINSWHEPQPTPPESPEHEKQPSKPVTGIEATIFVERKSQKPILIGRRGAMLKRIGIAAREEIERLIGGPVYLGLRVKHRERWRDIPAAWREVGATD